MRSSRTRDHRRHLAREATGQSLPSERAAGQLLEELAARAGDVIYRYVFVPEPALEYVNQAVTEATGHNPDEYYADPDLWFAVIYPEDRRALLHALRAGSPAGSLHLRWERRDGTLVWNEQRNVSIRGSRGTLIAFEGIARTVNAQPPTTTRRIGDLEIDFVRQTVVINGRVIRLTRAEFMLLAVLSERPEQIMSRDQLVKHMWDSEHVGDARACEVHISNLRRKIEPDLSYPQRVVTIRRAGYMLRAVSTQPPPPHRPA